MEYLFPVLNTETEKLFDLQALLHLMLLDLCHPHFSKSSHGLSPSLRLSINH